MSKQTDHSEQTDNSPDEMSDDQNTEAMTVYAEPEPEPELEDVYDDYDEFGDDANTPGRPRRVLVNRYSVGLVVVLVGAACFYGGVRLEKSKVTGDSGATASALTSRFGAASGTASKSGAAAKSGATSGTAGGFGGYGAPGAAASGTEGTIASISGDTVDVKESNGDTVKVKLSSATALTKTVKVDKNSLYPGDTVSFSGSTAADGTVTATSVSDSGASDSASTSSSGSAASTSSSSGTTGLSSLFGGS